MKIAGKRAIVFGGTSGIGHATSLALAARGAEVHAVGRSLERTAPGLPPAATLHKCDVRDETGVRELFTRIGRHDILISTATGGSRILAPFVNMLMDGFQTSFDKLWGYANVVRHGLDWLDETGVIVLVSGSPARRPRPGQVALSCVGASVEALVRGVAREIGPRRINAICPGLIDTPILLAKTGAEREEYYAQLTRDLPIARAGQPQECAEAILFLVENDYVTGTVLDVDGGIQLR